MSSQGQFTKFVAMVVQNLPELPAGVMQRWIESPVELGEVLKKTLVLFKVWKTIKIGLPNLRTDKDFRFALADGGFRIEDWTNDILGKPGSVAATAETEVDLVVVSVADLGFKSGTTWADLYDRAKELGLQLCPAEVGPQLRLQYKDQPEGEWLLIAMEPIPHSGGVGSGYLKVFCIRHDGHGRWLSGHHSSPDQFWGPGFRWVFLRGK